MREGWICVRCKASCSPESSLCPVCHPPSAVGVRPQLPYEMRRGCPKCGLKMAPMGYVCSHSECPIALGGCVGG